MIQEVGFDNLPNSYIDLVEISEFSPFANVINVHFVLKDVRKDGLFSWYKRDELGKYLKLLVVSSTNTSINDALDNGEMPLDKSKISLHPSFDATQVQFREIKVGWDKAQMLIDPIPTTDGEMFEFEYGERFYVKSSESNLKVYCATFVDTRQYSQDYRLDLIHTEISSYTGPVASEAVFSDGEVVRATFGFRSLQNDLWAGPTRLVNGTYYSGSSGGAISSAALRRITVPNTKIKDYRRPKLIRIEPSKVDSKLASFPDPAFSYNPDGSLSALFSIDLRSMLLRRSKIAPRLAIVDEKLLQKVIQSISFAKIIVRKQKIITKPSTSRSGSRVKKTTGVLHSKVLANTKDSAPFTLVPVATEESRFEEVILTEDPNVRHFALRDYNDYNSKGEYGYVLEVEFEDPTKAYVDSLATDVERNLASMKYYVERSQMPKNQNSSRTRLVDQFVQTELERNGPESQPWNVAVKLFTTYYSMFLDLNESKTNALANQTVAKIHPSFATPTSIQSFMKEYSDLHQHFIRYLSPKIKRVSNLKGRGNKGKSSDENKIFAKVTYKESVIHEERENAIVYYDFEEDVYPTVSIKEFVDRSQKEKGKFYNSKPSLAGTNLSKASKKTSEKLAKDADRVIGFLTPSKLQANKKKIDLSDPSSVDLSSFNEIYQKAKKKKDLIKVDPKPLKKSKLNIKVAKKIDKYIEPAKEETKTIEDNFGKLSKLRPAAETFRKTITSKLSSKIKSKVKLKNKKKISAKQFSADSRNIKQLIKKADKVRLPPSLISVMASESKSTKNNTLTASTDLASNSETKDFFSIMYTSPVQIETIKGYRKDARGRTMLNSPIWEILNEKDLESTTPIICRFTAFNTKYFETQGIEVNIANESFVLSPNEKITKQFNVEDTVSMQTILNIIESTEKASIEYLTSNPVKQSEDKNGPVR